MNCGGREELYRFLLTESLTGQATESRAHTRLDWVLVPSALALRLAISRLCIDQAWQTVVSVDR